MSGLVLGAWVLLHMGGTQGYANVPPVYFNAREACEAAAAWRNGVGGTPWFRCFPTGAQ